MVHVSMWNFLFHILKAKQVSNAVRIFFFFFFNLVQWPFSMSVCQLHNSVQEQRHIPPASYREIHPNTDNSTPHLYAHLTQREAWKRDALAQKARKDLKDEATGRAENQSCVRGEILNLSFPADWSHSLIKLQFIHRVHMNRACLPVRSCNTVSGGPLLLSFSIFLNISQLSIKHFQS